MVVKKRGRINGKRKISAVEIKEAVDAILASQLCDLENHGVIERADGHIRARKLESQECISRETSMQNAKLGQMFLASLKKRADINKIQKGEMADDAEEDDNWNLD